MYVVSLITFFAEDSLISASDRLMTTSIRTNWAPIWARVRYPLDGVTFFSTKIASFYVSHIWYEGGTLASHGRGKSQNLQMTWPSLFTFISTNECLLYIREKFFIPTLL